MVSPDASDRAVVEASLTGAPHPEIVTAEARLRTAQLAGDVAALDALLAEDLLFTGPDGLLWSKADDLAAHRDGLVRILVHEPESLRVRPLGDDGAITAMRARLVVAVDGAEHEGVYRYTRVWSRNPAGDWRVAGGHVSPVT